MTTATTPARIAPLTVACPRCGAGQDEQCISRTGRRFTASESHTARVDAARLAAGPPPAPAEARWAALREEIARDIAIEQELGDDYGDAGTDSSRDRANQHWGRAEALREVLATMDRMEAGQ